MRDVQAFEIKAERMTSATEGEAPAYNQDEWLWGWDATPGIVSVWAERDGRVVLWRRDPETRALIRETNRFRPWLLLASLEPLAHLGSRLAHEREPQSQKAGVITYRELGGPGHLRYYVSAADGNLLSRALQNGAKERETGEEATGQRLDLGEDLLQLAPEEQYLVATGRTYFGGLRFDDLRRLQFDLETTGLSPARDRIFLVSVRMSGGEEYVLDSGEMGLRGDEAEADLIRRLVALIQELDPDVIENHNIQGFDLPFLAARAKALGVPLALGRLRSLGLQQRPSARGYGPWRGGSGDADPDERDEERGGRYSIPGREVIDTMDAVRRYDFVSRDLPGHGLKAVARHFGLAPANRTYIDGPAIYRTWLGDPERVRSYALDDVREVDGLARLLGGSAFALARMAPRRYERLADAGPATGVLDPLIVRAYLRAGQAVPRRAEGDGTSHSGAALYLFAAGVARRVVKADVSSLYPSLMRQYRIGPRQDHLGVLLALVDRLVEQRLAAKNRAKLAPPGSPERHTDEALSAAMKILVNSAYGYLGAVGLTRCADVHAANEVTRQGRAVLGLLCRELAGRGATLLEGDTDGVYFAVPEGWTEQDERRVVGEVAALLPPLVRLEFEGRYAAMLSHEPKNYALLHYDGELLLRGVAFRSSRMEPFGVEFLRRATACLLAGDVPGMHGVYVETAAALRRRTIPTEQVTVRARLTKSGKQYVAARSSRREAAYEAMLASGRNDWRAGERIRFYRATGGRSVLFEEERATGESDPRDYDVAHYVRLLRETFAARLARAFTVDDFITLFADPEQPSLFAPPIESVQPILTPMAPPPGVEE